MVVAARATSATRFEVKRKRENLFPADAGGGDLADRSTGAGEVM